MKAGTLLPLPVLPASPAEDVLSGGAPTSVFTPPPSSGSGIVPEALPEGTDELPLAEGALDVEAGEPTLDAAGVGLDEAWAEG